MRYVSKGIVWTFAGGACALAWMLVIVGLGWIGALWVFGFCTVGALVYAVACHCGDENMSSRGLQMTLAGSGCAILVSGLLFNVAGLFLISAIPFVLLVLVSGCKFYRTWKTRTSSTN